MRPLALLLLAAFVAGCSSSADAPSTPSAPSHPDGGSPGKPGAAGTPGFTPLHWTHDYRQPDETRNFTIYASWGPLDLHVYLDGPQGAPVCSGSFDVKIVDPEGGSMSDGSSSTVKGSSGHCQTFVSEDGQVLAPGVWTVTFRGSGMGTAVLDLTKA